MNKIFGLVMLLTACGGSSSFKGEAQQGTAPATYNSDAKPVVVTPPPAPAPVPTTNPIPERAVIVGSFAAWTEPAQPLPFNVYDIVVRVTLPAKQAAGYTQDDLSGSVTGTDGYAQSFGSGFGYGSFETLADSAIIRIPVPAGSTNVQDNITIRSLILREERVLMLVF